MGRLRRLAQTLADYELLPVAVATALSTVWEGLLPYAVAAILLCALIRWIGTGRVIPRTGPDLGVLILLAMAGVSLWVTTQPEVTLTQVMRLLVGIGLFYSLAAWLKTARRIRIALWLGVLFGGLLAVMALISVEWVTDKLRMIDLAFVSRLPELIQDRVHPNVMAGSLALFVPFALGVSMFLGKPTPVWVRVFSACVGVGIGGVVVLTQSRGAYLGVAISILVLALLWSRWAGLALTASGLGLAGYILFSDNGLLQAYNWLVTAGGDTFGVRMEIWSRALFMLRDFPFTGVGMGSFNHTLNLLYPLNTETSNIGHTHQLFLQVAVDLGLPGLVGWLACLFASAGTAFVLFRQGSRMDVGWMKAAGASLLGAQAALTAHGMLDAVTWGTRAAPILWGLWGIGAGAWILYAKGTPARARVAR